MDILEVSQSVVTLPFKRLAALELQLQLEAGDLRINRYLVVKAGDDLLQLYQALRGSYYYLIDGSYLPVYDIAAPHSRTNVITS